MNNIHINLERVRETYDTWKYIRNYRWKMWELLINHKVAQFPRILQFVSYNLIERRNRGKSGNMKKLSRCSISNENLLLVQLPSFQICNKEINQIPHLEFAMIAD